MEIMDDGYKTTKAHFEKFCKYVHGYARDFGLQRYEFSIAHEEFLTDSRASVAVEFDSKIVRVYLDPYWDVVPTDRMLKKVALHEVLEVLLARLSTMAGESCSKERVEGETHAIIRTIEDILIK